MSRSLPGRQNVDLVGSKCQGGLSQGFQRAAALPPQTHLLRRVRRLRSVSCISVSPLRAWGRQEVILRVCLNFSKCVFLYVIPPKGLPALARFLSSSHFCVSVSVSLHFPLQTSYPVPGVSFPLPLRHGLQDHPLCFLSSWGA